MTHYKMDLYEIYDYEEELDIDEDAYEGKRYLSAVLSPTKGTEYHPLLDYRIEIPIFFRYPYELVNKYSRTYPYDEYLTPNIEIVQATFCDGKCVAVIKTYWLRVVQKAFRRLYNERQQWMKTVKKNILTYSYGFPKGRMPWPSIRGIICQK